MYWHGGMGPERACDSATGVPKYGNHSHIHLGPCFGMRVYRPSKSLRQCDRCAQIWKSFAYTPSPVYWHGYMGPDRACDSTTGRCAHIWKSFAYTPRPIYMYWDGGMGPERACDSATGVPKYGNHLHIHPCPCFGIRVYGV